MLLIPKALQVVKAASKDLTRPALCGIRIEADGTTVATNGHVLVRFRPTYRPEAKEFPAVEGCNAVDADGATLQPFTLPTESVNALLKAVPKTRRTMPILQNIALDVEQTNLNGCAIFGVTDLENPVVLRPRKLEDEFPTYQNVFPKGEATMVIGFTLAAFRDVLDTLKATEVDSFIVEIRDPLTPVKFIGNTKDRQGVVTALLMPARIDRPDEAPERDPAIEAEDKKWLAANAEIDEVTPADEAEESKDIEPIEID